MNSNLSSSNVQDSIAVFSAFDHLFTDIETAKRELVHRRRDAVLEDNVHANLGKTAPQILARAQKPTALLYRQVGTPLHETLLFITMAEQHGLTPLIIEYLDDKFVGAGNPYKRALGKLPIFQHTGSDGRDLVKYRTMVDFNSFVGKKISEACCISGMTLAEFHHTLLQNITGKSSERLCLDATDWFAENGKSATNYYEPFMTLFVRDCILFENYETSSQLTPFMHDVVIPAFEKVETRFGLRPLIVRLLPQHEEDRAYWNSYPKEIEPFLAWS